MKIGQRLKEARTSNNYSQQEVSEILHVSRSTISSWEIGRTYPSIELLINLSDLYGISLDQLLKEDKEIVRELNKSSQYKKWIVALFFCILILLIILLFTSINFSGKASSTLNFIQCFYTGGIF